MGKARRPRKLADNKASAKVAALRVSPRKLNLLAQAIRGKSVEAALSELDFSRRRIAADVKKVLQSAIANAENNHQLDVDRLVVDEANVGRSFVMKPWRAAASGASRSRSAI